MRSLLILALIGTTTLSLLTHSTIGQTSIRSEAASAPDLTGSWDGAQHESRNDDWGDLNVKATPAGYIGTYSDTFNKQLGSITFKSTGASRYEGLWWESDLKRYGSFVLVATKDAREISVEWKTHSPGGSQNGKSKWKRK